VLLFSPFGASYLVAGIVEFGVTSFVAVVVELVALVSTLVSSILVVGLRRWCRDFGGYSFVDFVIEFAAFISSLESLNLVILLLSPVSLNSVVLPLVSSIVSSIVTFSPKLVLFYTIWHVLALD